MNREPSSVAEACEEFLARRRRGERVDSAEFAARHAHLGPELTEALAAIEALEHTGVDRAEAFDLSARIGPYRVQREVGRGGMGVVLEAIEEPLGRRVALKVLPPLYLSSSGARARFRREAELAARLDHSGIATVYGTGVADDRPWIAMRYVDGETLAAAIAHARAEGRACVDVRRARDGGEPALAIAACIAEVARALQAAHEQGVVHRDVKPSNVIVTPEGAPVLVDFGLAIPEESSGHTLTRTGETAGTPAYIAPEIVGGERPRADAQGDVYALGVTLYECLTLRRPFDAPTPAALYRAIVAGEPQDVRALNSAVPRDLAVVVATAMERDRGRRYASAAALAADLCACAEHRPIAARPLRLHGRAIRWAQREPRQAVLAGLLFASTLAAALLGGAWWASRDEVHAAERVARSHAVESSLEQGFASLDVGRAVEADEAFARVLAIEPRNVDALVGRVLTSRTRRNDGEARARVAALPAGTRGRDVLAALVDGRPLVGNTLDALAPDTGAAELFIRGLCWQADAERRPFSERQALAVRALALYSEAVARSPSARALYYAQRAVAAQRAGDEKSARSASGALAALWPHSARALYAAGHALVLIDARSARTLLERSIAIDPAPLDTYNVLAQACINTADPMAAESWCRRGLERHPRAAVLHFLLAESFGGQGCIDDARGSYVEATALDPNLYAAWAQRAVYAFVDGEDELAIACYRRAFDLDARSPKARIFYGALLARAGASAEARVELDHSIAELYPADVGYWKAMGAVFAQIRAFDGALQVATAGLSLAPDDRELQEQERAARAELDRADSDDR